VLNSYRKGLFACAASLVVAAGTAQAGTHSVTIFDGGYFPAVIHVLPGDSIVFENLSEGSHVLRGANASTFHLVVQDETPLTYIGVNQNGSEVFGEISFQPAPLEE
jgi:plastocyanin